MGGNVDRITDFGVADDVILLDSRIFEGLVGEGVLSFGAFHKSSTGTAQDASDRIIYDTDGGTLSYDADGAGQTDAIRFARLDPGLRLTAEDFYIV
ncbi:Hemolysin-type calcium-binding protein [Rubellimicrobium mesophilum DSM 19309]|uniref:Hemolysin-type calcium-binding protein n=1 Tax=Rubellimicrobium mesophilum DSM 19309 TaxID=442562 RepID=A0A017HLU6_9RHOB|nr:hypothetical protein [Rubellimicrobium mesophilum]EYD75113.1 Hemolysin-type calcium-binding protein [Rubellimicrobium mesophilum DSM 19309]